MTRLVPALYVVGVAVVVYGSATLHSALLAPEPYPLLGDGRMWWWSLLALSVLILSYAVGLPELPSSRWGALGRGVLVTVVSFGVIAAIQALLATPLLPRSSSALAGALLPLWAVLSWNLSVDTTSWAARRDRIFLVVENPEDIVLVEHDLATSAERPATIAGWMSLDDVGGDRSNRLLEAVLAADASVLVLDTGAQAVPLVIDQAEIVHRDGVRIRSLALFYEEWIGKLPHRELARISLLFDIGALHRQQYVRFKRVIDIMWALIGLLALIPVTAAVACLNPFFNSGPLFYTQPRVGRDGREFVILKLRTMLPGTGSTDWTVQGDSRVTPLGALLRRSHLDELPQVLNILKGDLSLVGPRPEQPKYVTELREKIAFYDVRHLVRPGLTGWAQVKQGYTSDTVDAFDKLQYDFYYLRRQGLGLDGRIIWRTVRGVVGGDGR